MVDGMITKTVKFWHKDAERNGDPEIHVDKICSLCDGSG